MGVGARWSLRVGVCALALLGLGAIAHAGSPEGDIGRALEGPGLEGASVGVSVVEVGTGRVIFERNAGVRRPLASNTKLLTSAAAVGVLGLDHRLETTLYRRGAVLGAVLAGDLVVVGSGDPTLGKRFFGDARGPLDRFARALVAAGIRTVTGDLVLDDRFFDRELQHPGWPQDQLDRWYAAPVCALSLNDGCIDVTVSAGRKAGDPAEVLLEPSPRLVELELACRTTASSKEHVVAVGRRPGSERYIVRGGFHAGAAPFTTSVAQGQPALIFGAVLAERLAALGIELKGTVRLVAADEPVPASDPRAAPVVTHASLVAELLPVINKRSQNHYAEMLLKHLGAVASRSGSFQGGTAAAVAYARSLGVAEGEIVLVDGSGLARGNEASPRALCRVLDAMARRPDGSAFIASLALPGDDGTLERRLRDPKVASRVRAKTGTIRGVSTLSGYVLPETPGGPVVAFSILTSGLRGAQGARDAQDRVVRAIVASSGR